MHEIEENEFVYSFKPIPLWGEVLKRFNSFDVDVLIKDILGCFVRN